MGLIEPQHDYRGAAKTIAALPKTYASVQLLRAVAALGVLIFHLETQVGRMGYQGYWPSFLASGVDVFFVISGFIMWVTTYGKGITPLKFFWGRITRVVPLYWVMTSVSLVVLLLRPEWMQSGALDWSHLVSSYLFVPAVHPVRLTSMEPLVLVGWTLNYEMVFYAIFGAALLLPPTSRLLVTISALAALISAKLLSPEQLSLLWFYSSDIILEFGFGLLLGSFVTSGRVVSLPLSLALVGLGCAALAMPTEGLALPRVLERGIPAAAVVLGAISCELQGKTVRTPVLGYLGDASYSIYLVHGTVLSAFAQVWRRMAPDGTWMSYFAFVPLAIIAACVASILVYELVEKPITRALRQNTRRRIATTGSA